MKILLVQPDYLMEGVGFRLAALPEPLHLEMVAAQAEGHELSLLDMRFDADVEAAVGRFGPDVVAITALTVEVYAACDIARRVKACCPEAFVVVGGHHASLLPEDFFIPQVDAVALGEAELVFPQLLEALEGRRKLSEVPNLTWRDADGRFVANARTWQRVDLDRLPIPRRDISAAYRNEYYFLFDRPDTSVATGRGCPYRCNFCSVWQVHDGRINQASPERVLQELRGVQTRHVTFVDDNFLMNHRREAAIADMIRAEGLDMTFSIQARTDSIARHPELVEKWRDVGLYAILLGLEGVSDKDLKSVNKSNSAATNDAALKILRDNGIIIWGAFIADPDWTEDDFRRLGDYVRKQEITHTQFTVLTPLPGTRLYQEMYPRLITHDYSYFDTLHAVVPTRLPREEFYRHFGDLYRQADLGPYFDLVRSGKLTIENCRQGKAILNSLGNWQRLIETDPILGKGRPQDQACPGAAPAGRGTSA